LHSRGIPHVVIVLSRAQPQFESKRSEDVVEMNIKPALAFEHFAGRVSQPPRNATGAHSCGSSLSPRELLSPISLLVILSPGVFSFFD
jgi:hypothetical protein